MVKSGYALFFSYVWDLLHGDVGIGFRFELLETILSHHSSSLGSCVNAFTEDMTSELARIFKAPGQAIQQRVERLTLPWSHAKLFPNEHAPSRHPHSRLPS
jgi:hypothetical protein